MENISDCLIVDFREKQGKKAQPMVAIIDSQSSKNSSTCIENGGIDGVNSSKEGNGFILSILWEIYLTVSLFVQIATMEQRLLSIGKPILSQCFIR